MKPIDTFKSLGFKPTTTGGNCEALEKTWADGSYALLTNGEYGIPKSMDEPCTVSSFDVDGNEIESVPYDTCNYALGWLKTLPDWV